MKFSPEMLDEMLKEYKKPEDLLGPEGILKQLTKALVERCLNAEMDVHIGAERSQGEDLSLAESPKKGKNRRNGHSQKTIKGEFGQTEINIPRDRNGEFEPQLIGKGQTRFEGFDGKILALYARGMTTRDIQRRRRFSASALNCKNCTV